MEMRTATGKILLALAGTVGAALVVFVVAPWLQSPPPPRVACVARRDRAGSHGAAW